MGWCISLKTMVMGSFAALDKTMLILKGEMHAVNHEEIVPYHELSQPRS